MDKAYQELVENRIFVGGAAGVQGAAENVDIIIDLRAEAVDMETGYPRVCCPIVEDSLEEQDESIKQAIEQIKNAYDSGKKVYFHCAAGSNRAGTIAAGTLLALGKAKSVDEAVEKATSIRSVINVKPVFKESLKRIFPEENN